LSEEAGMAASEKENQDKQDNSSKKKSKKEPDPKGKPVIRTSLPPARIAPDE
jgi:hypothetical protein